MTRPAHAVRCRQCKNDFRKILEVESHARLHPNGISLDKDLYRCSYNGCNYRAIQKTNLINHISIHTRKKPWRCDRCGFSTGHRGSLSRHRKNGRCGVSTSTPVNSSSHNDYYQSDGPIASPLPTSSTSSSYPAVIAPLAISISPYAGMAPDQYGLPSFPHQLLPLPVLPEMEGLESNPPTWPLSNVSPLSQLAWTVADAMQASYCEYQYPSVTNTPLPSIEDTLSLTRIHIDYHV